MSLGDRCTFEANEEGGFCASHATLSGAVKFGPIYLAPIHRKTLKSASRACMDIPALQPVVEIIFGLLNRKEVMLMMLVSKAWKNAAESSVSAWGTFTISDKLPWIHRINPKLFMSSRKASCYDEYKYIPDAWTVLSYPRFKSLRRLKVYIVQQENPELTASGFVYTNRKDKDDAEKEKGALPYTVWRFPVSNLEYLSIEVVWVMHENTCTERTSSRKSDSFIRRTKWRNGKYSSKGFVGLSSAFRHAYLVDKCKERGLDENGSAQTLENRLDLYDLADECRRHGLPTEGSMNELQARLEAPRRLAWHKLWYRQEKRIRDVAWEMVAAQTKLKMLSLDGVPRPFDRARGR